MGILVGGGTKLAERAAAKFVPVPGVGAIIGGVMAGQALWDAYENWDKPGGWRREPRQHRRRCLGLRGGGQHHPGHRHHPRPGRQHPRRHRRHLRASWRPPVESPSSPAWAPWPRCWGRSSPSRRRSRSPSAIVTGIMNLIKMAISPLVMLFRALHTLLQRGRSREVEAQGPGPGQGWCRPGRHGRGTGGLHGHLQSRAARWTIRHLAARTSTTSIRPLRATAAPRWRSTRPAAPAAPATPRSNPPTPATPPMPTSTRPSAGPGPGGAPTWHEPHGRCAPPRSSRSNLGRTSRWRQIPWPLRPMPRSTGWG